MEKRLEALDSWRGVTALIVVLYHFSAEFNWSWRGEPYLKNMDVLIDFFFVLSGFVITGAYEKKLRESKDISGFFLRRLGRLWPMHLFTLGLMVAYAVARGISNGQLTGPDGIHDGALYDLSALPSNILMLQAVGLENHFTWNFPSWSASTEFYTYFVFAALWVWVGRQSLILTVLTAIGIPILLLFWVAPGLTGSVFFVCIYCFALGALLRKGFDRVRGRWAFMQNTTIATLAEVGALALAFGYMTTNVQPQQLAPLVFSVWVFVFAFDGGLISRALMTPLPRMLGTTSYSIYLLHIPLFTMGVAMAVLLQNATGLQLQYAAHDGAVVFGSEIWIGNLLIAGAIAINVAIATVTYRLIEVPGQDWGNRLAKRWKQRQSVKRRSVATPIQPAE